MKLYAVRHGETTWNKEHLIQGHTDIPLDEKGIEQARETALALKDIRFDLIFVSPLKRAEQTLAEIRVYHPSTPVIEEPRLEEMCYGKNEGTTRIGGDYEERKRHFFMRNPKGESYLDVAARIYPFIDECRKKYPDKTLLFVCHGRLMALIYSYFHNMTNEEFASWDPPNGKALYFTDEAGFREN